MFKVLFNRSLFAIVSNIEEACSMALAVHRTSNVEHSIYVTSEDVNSVIITFSFVSPKKDK